MKKPISVVSLLWWHLTLLFCLESTCICFIILHEHLLTTVFNSRILYYMWVGVGFGVGLVRVGLGLGLPLALAG